MPISLWIPAFALALSAPQSVRLNAPLAQPVSGTVRAFAHGPTGARLVYVADQDVAFVPQLYSVPLDASAPPILLSPGVQPVARSLTVSRDGARVAFLAQDVLHCAPTDGSSAAVPLTGPLLLDDPDLFRPEFSPDGAWLVYREDVFPVGYVRLSAVPADGEVAPVTLASSPGNVGEFAISSDSARVVFTNSLDLFSVPIDGSSSALQLDPPSSVGGANWFQLSPDATRVVYLSTQDSVGRLELYGVPIDGSAGSVKLSGTMVFGGNVSNASDAFAIGADARVVFLADRELDERFELFSAPLDGSAAPIQVSGPMGADRDVTSFQLTPDGRRAVLVADRHTNEVFELYLARIDAIGTPTRLIPSMPAGGDVRSFPAFQITADSSHVVYLADQLQDEVFELFTAPIGNVRPTQPRPSRLSAPLAPGKQVTNFTLSPEGRFAVYIASGLADGRSGSFSVLARGGESVALTPTLEPGGSVGPTTPVPGHRGVFQANLDGVSGTNLYQQSLREGVPAIQLNAPLAMGPPVGDVSSYAATPQGDVVYLADQERDEVYELYRSPVDGSSAPVRLSGPMTFGGSIGGGSFPVDAFVSSPDGTRYAYHADQAVDGRTDLYSGPVDGSTPPILLDAPETAFPAVQRGMRFSLDGARVVYLRRTDPSHQKIELFSALADGSAPPIRLNGNMVSTLSHVEPAFAFSPDGLRVVYRSDEATLGKLEVFSVPVDGSANRVRLNAVLASTRDVTAFRIDPSSASVVYLADQDSDERFELYRVPIAGGAAVALVSALNPAFTVRSFGIDPTGTRVVYSADAELDQHYELFSVALAGGASVKLSGPFVTGGNIDPAGLDVGWKLAPDGTRAVYSADQDTDGQYELYSAPLDGGSPAVKVSGTRVPGFGPLFAVTPDSRRVLFAAEGDVPGVARPWLAPLDGHSPPRELGPLPVGHSASQFSLDAHGFQVLIVAQDSSFDEFLFRVPLDGGRAEAVTTTPSIQFGLRGVRFAPGSSRALFLSDLEQGGVLELYSARLPRVPLRH